MKKHLVLSAKLNEELLRESPHLLLRYLPPRFRSDVLKYKRKRKQWLSFTGKLLLAQGLNILEKKKLTKRSFRYTEQKKPYLDDQLGFNISHSNDRVICVIAPNHQVGVDLQENGKFRIAETAHLYFDQETQKQIATGQLNLIELWCRAEAFSKAIGTGLDQNIKNYNVLEASTIRENVRWNFFRIPVDPSFECVMVTDEIHPTVEYHEYRLKFRTVAQTNS